MARTSERVAGVAGLVLAAFVGLATVAHAGVLLQVLASGRVADTDVQVRDGVVVVSEMYEPDSVAAGTVASGLVSDATILAVAALVAVIGIGLLRARPFGRRLPFWVGAVGIIVAVGGTLGAAIGAATDRRVQSLASQLSGGMLPRPLELPLGILTLPLLPLAAGLTILLLAFVFRAGTRLQRDTDGLV